MATKKAPAAPAAVLIHEVNDKIQHRIVVVKNGVVDAGTWREGHEIAVHKDGYYANLESKNPLPVGIFRVSRVQTQTVGY